ncbi:serpentine type 7TM GPCR chemoreceptor srbc domain-containing protein [Ditylenchus destructor]|uniref:Serpentine type 7TM GPCR chemoreceptor srbc domain-containing protein n=1 Tax=Ditylenchus destructor TaxID=166010 RepID=A0AAD4MRL2_9BILA|nr:serpentine type 7TM GPCR chemoreceptor srbc domain-containing protein [Ditylenchus destructor]
MTIDKRVILAMYFTEFLLFLASGIKMLLMLIKILSDSNKSRLSNILLLNMLCYSLMCFAMLPGNVFQIVVIWMSEGGNIDQYRYAVFWTTAPANCMLPVVTWSVFFLCLDRLLLVCSPAKYTCERQSNIYNVTRISLVLVYLFNFWAFLWELPLLHNYDCVAFNCFMQKTGSQGFIYSKISGGLCVILCSLTFIYQLKWKKKEETQQKNVSVGKKIVNRLVLLQMCTEICLNFIPQVLIVAIFQFTGIVVGTYIGSHNWLFGSIDAFISAALYNATGLEKKGIQFWFMGM